MIIIDLKIAKESSEKKKVVVTSSLTWSAAGRSRTTPFYQRPSHARAVLMDNVKSLGGELASISQRFTLVDAQKVSAPTLLVKGELSPRFFQIIGIVANCMPNSQELIIPAESHNLGLEKPQVFNTDVLEFLSIYS
jgi:pimeloyl-ACP methyl ester carboxylesterase